MTYSVDINKLKQKNLYIHSLGKNKGLYIKMWRGNIKGTSFSNHKFPVKEVNNTCRTDHTWELQRKMHTYFCTMQLEIS